METPSNTIGNTHGSSSTRTSRTRGQASLRGTSSRPGLGVDLRDVEAADVAYANGKDGVVTNGRIGFSFTKQDILHYLKYIGVVLAILFIYRRTYHLVNWHAQSTALELNRDALSAQVPHFLLAYERRSLADRFELTALDKQSPFIPVLMPVYSRLEYLNETLQALSRCDLAKNVFLVISQDGTHGEVTEFVTQLSTSPDSPFYKRVIFYRHTRPYFNLPSLKDSEFATTQNVYDLLRFAFEDLGASGTILLEDDIVPGRDMLTYFRWVFQRIMAVDRYNDIMTATAFNKSSSSDSVRNAYTLSHVRFTGWGWMTARNRWPWIKSHWTRFDNWDITIADQMELGGKSNLQPALARTKNIGMRGVNFDIDPNSEQAAAWKATYVSPTSIDYDHEPMILPKTRKR